LNKCGGVASENFGVLIDHTATTGCACKGRIDHGKHGSSMFRANDLRTVCCMESRCVHFGVLLDLSFS
jgi:hypothetical protein